MKVQKPTTYGGAPWQTNVWPAEYGYIDEFNGEFGQPWLQELVGNEGDLMYWDIKYGQAPIVLKMLFLLSNKDPFTEWFTKKGLSEAMGVRLKLPIGQVCHKENKSALLKLRTWEQLELLRKLQQKHEVEDSTYGEISVYSDAELANEPIMREERRRAVLRAEIAAGSIVSLQRRRNFPLFDPVPNRSNNASHRFVRGLSAGEFRHSNVDDDEDRHNDILYHGKQFDAEEREASQSSGKGEVDVLGSEEDLVDDEKLEKRSVFTVAETLALEREVALEADSPEDWYENL